MFLDSSFLQWKAKKTTHPIFQCQQQNSDSTRLEVTQSSWVDFEIFSFGTTHSLSLTLACLLSLPTHTHPHAPTHTHMHTPLRKSSLTGNLSRDEQKEIKFFFHPQLSRKSKKIAIFNSSETSCFSFVGNLVF